MVRFQSHNIWGWSGPVVVAGCPIWASKTGLNWTCEHYVSIFLGNLTLTSYQCSKFSGDWTWTWLNLAAFLAVWLTWPDLTSWFFPNLGVTLTAVQSGSSYFQLPWPDLKSLVMTSISHIHHQLPCDTAPQHLPPTSATHLHVTTHSRTHHPLLLHLSLLWLASHNHMTWHVPSMFSLSCPPIYWGACLYGTCLSYLLTSPHLKYQSRQNKRCNPLGKWLKPKTNFSISTVFSPHRTPESSAKCLIQILAIFICTNFGSSYLEIGSGPKICWFLSTPYLRPRRKSLKILCCATNYAMCGLTKQLGVHCSENMDYCTFKL